MSGGETAKGACAKSIILLNPATAQRHSILLGNGTFWTVLPALPAVCPIGIHTQPLIAIERKNNSVGSCPAEPLADPPSTSSGSRKSERTPKKDAAKRSTLSQGATPPSSSPGPGQTGAGDAAEERDYRVAVFGAGGVGKSSIVLRFIKNSFSETYVPTIEDTYQQVITCSEQGRLAVCTLHIIDTTGSHQFPAMQRLAIARGNAFVLVYSVTSRQSLEELGPIVRTLKEVKGDQMGEVPVMLVGNKADEAAQRREVAQETGEVLAERWNCGFVETSAKTSEHITELFQRLLALEKRRHLTLNAPEAEGEKQSAGARRRCAIM